MIIGASKIARDITESKRIQAKLMESEARFRQLADAMPQMVWTARPDGSVDYFNERWYEFTGFGRDAFGDANSERILHPEDLQKTRATWYAAVSLGNPTTLNTAFSIDGRIAGDGSWGERYRSATRPEQL